MNSPNRVCWTGREIGQVGHASWRRRSSRSARHTPFATQPVARMPTLNITMLRLTLTLSCMIGARNRGSPSTSRPRSHGLLSNQERKAMRFSRVLLGAPVQHAQADLRLLQSASVRDIAVATSSPESPHFHRQLEAGPASRVHKHIRCLTQILPYGKRYSVETLPRTSTPTPSPG